MRKPEGNKLIEIYIIRCERKTTLKYIKKFKIIEF